MFSGNEWLLFIVIPVVLLALLGTGLYFIIRAAVRAGTRDRDR